MKVPCNKFTIASCRISFEIFIDQIKERYAWAHPDGHAGENYNNGSVVMVHGSFDLQQASVTQRIKIAELSEKDITHLRQQYIKYFHLWSKDWVLKLN